MSATAQPVHLDRSSPVALHRQLYGALRDQILDGSIAPGSRLPSTRNMASELGVGRNTVITAFEQLLAEGYLESQVGAGTHVVDLFPMPGDPPHHANGAMRSHAMQAPSLSTSLSVSLSRRGQLLAQTPRFAAPAERAAFAPGLPALDRFPFASWNRLLARCQRSPAADELGYEHSAGHPALRKAIADYLRRSRGVRCGPGQVVILSGAQAALDLTARMLLDPGDALWLEDPGYLGARGAFRAAGARIVPVRLDGEGLDVAAGIAAAGAARLAYVTPSFQFPSGVTMSLERRLALLRWASRNDAWVIEDDYDSEYRYRGRPLSALQGIDAERRVIYTGTFSKTMYPSLRLGYVVVPEDLEQAFSMAIRHTGHAAPVIPQLALARFIDQGTYASHLRRMRGLYARRQTDFVVAVQECLGTRVRASVPDGGMQIPCWLQRDVDDQAVARDASAAGLHISPLSAYHLGPPPADGSHRGFYLGFAGVPEAQVRPGLTTLAALVDRHSS